MRVSYIVRLDDSHRGQNHPNWKKMEDILDEFGITPIVAIIPENRDASLNYQFIDDVNYWEMVKEWNQKGWGLAMHGLHHMLRVGYPSILPITDFSEFSGHSDRQLNILQTAMKVFEKHGCVANYFIAPAHGFDAVTIEALKSLTPSLIVSDGFGFRPYIDKGIKFLPQQFWRGHKMPFGVWTICLHPCTMDDAQFIHFKNFARNNLKNFQLKLDSIEYKDRGLLDVCASFFHKIIFNIKKYQIDRNNRANGFQ